MFQTQCAQLSRLSKASAVAQQKLLQLSRMFAEVPPEQLARDNWHINVSTVGMHLMMTVSGNGWEAEQIYWELTGLHPEVPVMHDGYLTIRLADPRHLDLEPTTQ